MRLSKLVTGASGFLLVFALQRAAHAQEWLQKHSEDALWRIATEAYNALPAHPSPAHSDVFLRALANLHAYAEISVQYRREPQRAQQVNQALTWLIENLRAVVPPESKGDEPGRLERIQNRGLAAYDSLRRNQAGSRFRSYAAAVTNLYVARQMTDNVRAETMGALSWLGANPIRAGSAGKADEAGGGEQVLPNRAKPDAFTTPPPKRPRPGIQDRPDVQDRPNAGERGGQPSQPVADVSGRWRADDGGTYYVRQIGADIWWLGESADNGSSWSNIFAGNLDAASGRITGTWADVPKGGARSGGQLVLRVVQNGRLLTVVSATGGFGGKIWRRIP